MMNDLTNCDLYRTVNKGKDFLHQLIKDINDCETD